MSKRRKHLYEFGRFTLDASNRLLLRAGEPVPLHPKAFDTLLLLVEHRGDVLGKEDLIGRLWPDSFVEESNLSQNIYILRKALGQDEDGREYIKTVPKRGYQFVADVREEVDAVAEVNSRAGASEKEEEETTAAADGTWTESATKDKPLADEPLARAGVRRTPLLVLAAAALAVGLIVGAYFWFTNRTIPPGRPAIRSIAVLPFRPLSAEGRDESLELGMADTLVFRLSAVRGLAVRPISAVRKYADLDQDALAAGREQQVDAVLDSTIQTAGGRVRVTSRLLRVADGAVLWADRSEQQSADLFAVQDAIAEKLAKSLAPKLTEGERQRLTKRYTDNTEAYQLYLRGRYFSEKRTREGITKGIEYFQQAIDKDPDYALAYAGLADSYVLLRLWALVPAEETVPRARAAAEEALRLDDSLAEAHTALARVKEHYLNWPGAETEYRRAIELNPTYETAHHWYAMHLAAMGRLDEALAEVRRAQEIDPLSLIINLEMGRVLFFRREYDEAIAQLRKTLEMEPNFGATHVQLGVVYEQKGMYEEAIAEYQKMPAGGLARIGRVYALSGKRREAQKVLDELKEQSVSPIGNHRRMALIHASLDENEQAITWLEKAFDVGDEDFLYFLRVDPTWDGLHSEPRFQALLRRVGLLQ